MLCCATLKNVKTFENFSEDIKDRGESYLARQRRETSRVQGVEKFRRYYFHAYTHDSFSYNENWYITGFIQEVIHMKIQCLTVYAILMQC